MVWRPVVGNIPEVFCSELDPEEIRVKIFIKWYISQLKSELQEIKRKVENLEKLLKE